jgi:DNA-binding transcriptional regulator YhcF (GntR family)
MSEKLKLTKSERTILEYYRSLKEEKFCCSLLTIARATGMNEKTIRRANDHCRQLGLLSWIRGNGNRVAGMPCHPNRYWLRGTERD